MACSRVCFLAAALLIVSGCHQAFASPLSGHQGAHRHIWLFGALSVTVDIYAAVSRHRSAQNGGPCQQ